MSVPILQQQRAARHQGSDPGLLYFTPHQIANVCDAAYWAVEQNYPLLVRAFLEHARWNRNIALGTIGTVNVEVPNFEPIHEMGGDAYFHRMYDIQGARPEVARQLGNVTPGDGIRYHGRGYIQLTGRSNYRNVGAAINEDLEGNPDRALDPLVAAAVFAVYFRDRGILELCDNADWWNVRGRVNDGRLGYDIPGTQDDYIGAILNLDAMASNDWVPGRVLMYPLARGYVTDQGTHGGWPAADIFAPEGTPIFAPVGGWSAASLFRFGGYATIIQGDDGVTYYMAHGSRPFKGGRIEAGEIIGAVGSTGTGPQGFADKGGTAPHLHLAMANDGNINRGNRGGSGNMWFDPRSVWGQS